MQPQCKVRYCCYHHSVAVLIALLLVGETRGQLQDNQTLTRLTLLNMFEEALANSSMSLFKLRQIYFDPSAKYTKSVCLDVTVTIDNILGDSDPNQCIRGAAFVKYAYHSTDIYADSNYTFSSQHQLQLLSDDGGTGTSKLGDLLSYSFSAVMFYAFDPTFYKIMQVLTKSLEIDPYSYPSENFITIDIHISGELEVMPCWEDAVHAMRMLLVWVKAYARAGGMPLYKQEEDRSTVSDAAIWECPEKNLKWTGPIDIQFTSGLFMSIFSSFYILVLSLTIIYIHKVFRWLQQQGNQTKLLYKASATVLTLVNIITLILDVYFCAKNGFVNIFALIVLSLRVLIASFVELPVICFRVYRCEHDRRNDRRCYRFAHAFALWQIICFIHRLITDVIISVVFFIIAPAQTLSVVTLLLSIVASAIAYVAIIIKKGCVSCRTSCKVIFCAAFNGIIVTETLVVITFVFIIFVDNGLESTGMGGLILSLIPPFIVFVIGFYVRRYYFRPTNSGSSAAVLGEQPNTSTNNVDLERFILTRNVDLENQESEDEELETQLL